MSDGDGCAVSEGLTNGDLNHVVCITQWVIAQWVPHTSGVVQRQLQLGK
jgi:hypothetical protein